jgi:hypothetical protein
MTEDEVKARLEEACRTLYFRDRFLIDTQGNERNIVCHLAGYMRQFFQDWAVDTEYNRVGDEGDPKRDERGRLLFPDIIIHTRGERLGPNLAVIEVKGFWNSEDRDIDEGKLRGMAAEYGYQWLFRLELGAESAEVISVPRVLVQLLH